MSALKPQIADELLSLAGKLEYIEDKKALRALKILNSYLNREAFSHDRAWRRKGTNNNHG
ncbi:hypothetical protein [uncultured Endozoicomonas sp.]|uniref:hypothetical protein n=1 Tax=uncultured Endozoicomonas sp. TaxID=432652 RepID=UPI002632755D|nr:hypothetical protein [uncultured Endozoicomonas sp.]